MFVGLGVGFKRGSKSQHGEEEGEGAEKDIDDTTGLSKSQFAVFLEHLRYTCTYTRARKHTNTQHTNTQRPSLKHTVQ